MSKLADLAAKLRERAAAWRVDASQNRNDWADLLEAIAEDIESAIGLDRLGDHGQTQTDAGDRPGSA